MSTILETETSNLGYNGIKTEISRHSRNVNRGLQTESDDSKREIKNNTLSSLANIKIKQIRLPKILTQSTDVNYNKKIIKLKKNLLKKEEDESTDKFLITGLENKAIDTYELTQNDNNNKNKKKRNSLFEVAELLLNSNEIKKNEKSKAKKKLNISLKERDEYFSKMSIRKKPKNIEKIESQREKKLTHSLQYLKKMSNCYLNYQKKNIISDFKDSTRKLDRIGNKIHNIFDIMREDTDTQFQELLKKDSIEFY
jgi:hypothetical protein